MRALTNHHTLNNALIRSQVERKQHPALDLSLSRTRIRHSLLSWDACPGFTATESLNLHLSLSCSKETLIPLLP